MENKTLTKPQAALLAKLPVSRDFYLYEAPRGANGLAPAEVRLSIDGSTVYRFQKGNYAAFYSLCRLGEIATYRDAGVTVYYINAR